MKQVRWGVLGTGRVVAKTGQAIQRSANGVWLGVAGRNLENSRSAALQFGVPRAYDGYEALLRDSDIDAVYIAILNHHHMEWAIKAIEYGKHLLVEKPFSLNAEQARAIAKTAERSRVQVMEAFAWRFHPAHRVVKDLIREGAIGEVILFHGHFSFIAPADSTRWVRAWGGGSLYDIGCYPVSWSRYFMEEEPIAADCLMVHHPQTGVDQRCIANLFFSGGRVAQISSALDMGIGSYYFLLGNQGRIDVNFHVTSDKFEIIVSVQGKTKVWTTDRVEPYVFQMEAFAQCIAEGKPVPYGIPDAIRNMAVLDALFEADRVKNRMPIEVQP